jgi:hypothetical protein
MGAPAERSPARLRAGIGELLATCGARKSPRSRSCGLNIGAVAPGAANRAGLNPFFLRLAWPDGQLEPMKQGEGWVFRDWKQPVDAGRVIAYNIQRRNRTDGVWQDVATAIETESILVDQPEKTELEYRVIAINKAGEGSPSNTVMVVL